MKTTKQQRAEYSQLRREGKLCGTIKAAMQKRAARESAMPTTAKYRSARARYMNGMAVAVPLGAGLPITDVENWLRDTRVRHWAMAEPTQNPSHVEDQDGGSYSGRYRAYSVVSHVPCIQSCAIVFAVGKTVWAKFDGQSFTLRAPRGYRWYQDGNGLCLVGKAGDYHPTMSEMLEPHAPRNIARKLRENSAKRRDSQRSVLEEMRKIKSYEREGLMVCFRDSVDSGNCSAGTDAWMRIHGFERGRHYRPSEILVRAANGDTRRVVIVVAQAARRHSNEIRNGMCQLADHR